MITGPGTMTAFHREANSYRLPDLNALISGIEQVDAALADGQAVVATVGVGKWVEGITGRTALFSMPNRYSFREVEIERSLAAETLVRSTFSASDGQFFLRYTSADGDVPTSPWVAVNHRGEYIDLLQLRGSDLELVSQGKVVATLNSLTAGEFDYVVDDYVVYLDTVFMGEREGQPILVEQAVVLNRASNTLVVTYEVTSPLPIDEVRAGLAPVAEHPEAVNAGMSAIDLDFVERAQARPRLMVRAPQGHRLHFDIDSGRTVVSAAATRLELSIAFEKSAPPINEAAVFSPAEIVEEYNIGAAFLPMDDAMETRQARLEALGFREFGEVASHLVLIRRTGGEDDLTSLDYELP
jgi:hypothetical protein